MSEDKAYLTLVMMTLFGCLRSILSAHIKVFTAGQRAWAAFKSLGFIFLAFSFLASLSAPALALDPILIKKQSKKGDSRRDIDNRININKKGDFYLGKSLKIQVTTAPDAEGITQRMAVRSKFGDEKPNWVVFALKNTTGHQVERWLVADRYNVMGSGLFWPDLDRQRIVSVTPSMGFRPERISSDQTDIFRLTVEPGATVTFVAELTHGRFPNLSLWKSASFEDKRRDGVLFHGILLGSTSLLALLLSVMFIANPRVLFPAAALVAWSFLAYFCVDFGFWGKLFNLSAEKNAFYRGITEAAIPTSLTIFLYLFLRINLWHNWVRYLFYVWSAALVGVMIYASFEPQIGSGLARLGLVATVGMSGFLLLFLTFSGHGRAMSLLPTWLLFGVWLFAGMMAVNGVLQGDFIPPVLNAGLMLFLVLIGLLVTQFAFEHAEFVDGTPPGALQKKLMALQSAGASVWEWDARKDRIQVDRAIEESLGLAWGSLKTREQWLSYMHPSDRDRFAHVLADIKIHDGGSVNDSFRMRRTDGSFLWFNLKAFSQEVGTRRSVKCIGLIYDDTASKRMSETLKTNSVVDSMTGLANKEIFLDRLSTALVRTRENRDMPPTVIMVDINRFSGMSSKLAIGMGDTILLTAARRIAEYLRPQDSLARVADDHFAIKLNAMADMKEVAELAEKVRLALKEPIVIGGETVFLTSSIGMTVYNGTQIDQDELYREAEIAMFHAKFSGVDKIEFFQEEMRGEENNHLSLLHDLRQAISQNEFEIVYQPIIRLSRDELVGFEALLQWHHPRLGLISPEEFIPLAEKNGLIHKIGLYVLESATTAVISWNRQLKSPKQPVYVSINVLSEQLFRGELVNDVRQMLAGKGLPGDMLKLEISEAIVMKNPEESAGILARLKALGVGLSMDDFGMGYSSLSHLLRFPFDMLKIDKELVNLEHDGKVILSSVVAMAHELGKYLVAEGVDKTEEVNFLRAIECDYGQGLIYGEPMDNEGVTQFLSSFSFFNRHSLKLKRKKTQKEKPQDTAPIGQLKPIEAGDVVPNGNHVAAPENSAAAQSPAAPKHQAVQEVTHPQPASPKPISTRIQVNEA